MNEFNAHSLWSLTWRRLALPFILERIPGELCSEKWYLELSENLGAF